MNKFSKILSVLAISVVVAGCQSQPRSNLNSGSATPDTAARIQGDWRSVDGPLLATFDGTKFQSVNTTNNQVVASGAFHYISSQDIRLEWVGALSGRNSAKCRLIETDLLDCVPSNGSGFQMRRV